MSKCVDSGYCMQEFDIAFHHNIMVKRKKRLVILMSLDSPTDLYNNDASDTAALRQYLRQYTYIDYTTDDWLDNLLYALPLRGLLQSDQNGEHHAIGDEAQPQSLQETGNPFQGEQQPYLNHGFTSDALLLQ